VALCYLWLMLSMITGVRRYAVIGALFGFVKWTAFPFIFVALAVHLAMSGSFKELRQRLVLPVLCGGTVMLLFLALPGDAVIFLKGLLGQEFRHTNQGISLKKFLPGYAVKALPFVLVAVGIVNRLNYRRDASYLIPFLAGSATILATYPTYAYDYSLPCLTAFVPCMIYWAGLPGVGRAIGKIVPALFFFFLLLASCAHKVFYFSEPDVIMTYVVMAVILVGTTFFVSYQDPGGEPLAPGRGKD
jgi:hypothetical protein